MRKCFLFIFTVLMIIVVMCPSVLSADENASGDTSVSQIVAYAEREFTFGYPGDVKTVCNEESIVLGNITFDDLFLFEDESLILTVETSPLTHTNGRDTLPYAVDCGELPLRVAMGESPSIEALLRIGKTDWKNAKAGDYSAVLTWKITSSLTGETLMEQQTHIRAEVSDAPPTGDFGQPAIYLAVLALSSVFIILLIGRKHRGTRLTTDRR